MDAALISAAYAAISAVLPAALPHALQQSYAVIRPSMSWGISSALLAAKFPGAFCVLAIPHASAAALALFSVGMQHKAFPLAFQLLYAPAIASYLAWSLRNHHSPDLVTVVFVAALHVLNTLLSVVATMVYPAPFVPYLMDLSVPRSALKANPQLARLIHVPLLGTSGAASPVALEGIVIRPSGSAPRFGKPRIVLYLGGNGELFEGTFGGLVTLADRLQATIVTVNPKGVGNSGGATSASTSDLVDSARSAMEYILTRLDSRAEKAGAARGGDETPAAEGQPCPRPTARDVVVLGHSIGGGVAAILVSQHYPEASLVLDRTFSSLEDAALSLSPVGRRPTLVKVALTLAGFGGMNNVAGFNAVPHRRKLITFHRGDQIIRHQDASLARLPEFDPSRCDLTVELHGASVDPHNVGITELQGFEQVRQRIGSFFSRKLSE